MREPVKSIRLMRGGGSEDSERRYAVCGSFAEANRVLYRWSLTAPTRRSEPVVVMVLWADGVIFDGRYALRHQCAGEGLLEDFVARTCAAYCGRAGDEALRARIAAQPEARHFADILDRHDLAGSLAAKTA